MTATGTITLNGRGVDVEPGATVGHLVDGLGRGRAGLAVALNDEVVPRSEWDETSVREGDRLEILTAAQGG